MRFIRQRKRRSFQSTEPVIFHWNAKSSNQQRVNSKRHDETFEKPQSNSRRSNKTKTEKYDSTKFKNFFKNQDKETPLKFLPQKDLSNREIIDIYDWTEPEELLGKCLENISKGHDSLIYLDSQITKTVTEDESQYTLQIDYSEYEDTLVPYIKKSSEGNSRLTKIDRLNSPLIKIDDLYIKTITNDVPLSSRELRISTRRDYLRLSNLLKHFKFNKKTD